MVARAKKITELSLATSVTNTDLFVIEQVGVNSSSTKKVTANTVASYVAGRIGAISGAKGDKGEPGTAGTNGLKGDKGDAGVAGTKGDKGEAGLNGAAAAKGDKGEVGAKGDIGAKGDKGIQGVPGADGLPGLEGPQGDTGAQGVSVTLQGTKATIADLPPAPVDYNDFAGHGWIVTTGDGETHLDGSLWFWNLTTGQWNDIGPIVGPAGPRGPQGFTGSKGEPGAQGDTGNKGEPGTAGSVGAKGEKGDSGDGANTTIFQISDTAPVGNTLWFNSIEARMYVNYDNQWVDTNPTILPPPETNPTFESVTFNDASVQTTAWLGTYSYNDLTDVPPTPTFVGGGSASTWLTAE